MKNIQRTLLPWFIMLIGLILLVVIYNMKQPVETDKEMPTDLHPIVKEKKETLIYKTAAKNIQVVITDGLRTVKEQNELYDRGRETNGRKITNAKGGESYHNYGLAIDYALKNPAGEVIWDIEYDGNSNGKSDWLEVASIAKELGFEWGGDWKAFKDYPHLQMTFGLSIAELQRGSRPDEKEG
ncbi:MULTISPECIES: M15 family metallopeptidase [Clostridia]|uniref:M15 family metallopeptidase n=1 Tax=Clostridia TaxID=186801 RepID=UPI000EA09C8E|nr:MULTISPECIES: M15 family metallopeptidase [Clostridia]NBJ69996.1 M15 family peptidase [Roseburia sp. 1XD42-34]RKI77363.1 M15 family peptidase [Clostridium sp. 1xD42-85]